MSTVKGKIFKILLATLALIMSIPIALLVSGMIFQGYMQPDGRGYIWQDIAIITAITFTYTFYVFKVILKTTD